MSLRVVFAGSPAIATPYLDALVEAGCDVVAVITRVDSPIGRKRVVTPTPVAQRAHERGLTIIKTNSLRDTVIPDADLGVVVAYGGLVPQRLLEQLTHGWINVHFSMLPEYRGAAPVQRAMWDGRDTTGISIFRLVPEMDAGPVFHAREIAFEPHENASDALARIAALTTHDLIATIRGIDDGTIVASPQSGDPSYAPKFERHDGRINWRLDGSTVVNRIRAVTREPGAFTVRNGETFGVLRASLSTVRDIAPGVVSFDGTRVLVGTADFAVELHEVTPPGRSSMNAIDWARGQRAEVAFE